MEHIKENEDFFYSSITFNSDERNETTYLACSPECAAKTRQKFTQERENYQKEKEKMGWKRCEGKLFWPDILGGTQNCEIMVPPGEKLCDNHKRWAGEKESERIREACDKEHERAQRYWDSLDEEQKKAKIKKIEEKLRNKYKNTTATYSEGNIRYDYYWEWDSKSQSFRSQDMNKVPISVVEEFMKGELGNNNQSQDEHHPLSSSFPNSENTHTHTHTPEMQTNFLSPNSWQLEANSNESNGKVAPNSEIPPKEPEKDIPSVRNNDNEDQLSSKKRQIVEEISAYLDNSPEIDLKSVAQGKYQNWKKDIEKLVSEEEIIQYKNSLIQSLNEIKLNSNKTAAYQNKTSENSKFIFITGICILIGGLSLIIGYLWTKRKKEN